MNSMHALLAAVADADFVDLVGVDGGKRLIDRLASIESIEDLRRCEANSVVIVPRHQIEGISGFDLDVAVRYAADRGAAGLVLIGARQVPVTVQQLARRAEMPLIGYIGSAPLVDVIHTIDRGLGTLHEPAIDVLRELSRRIELVPADHPVHELVEVAQREIGVPIRLEWLTSPLRDSREVVVHGVICGHVSFDRATDPQFNLALTLLADAVGRHRERDIDRSRTAGELVMGILTSDSYGREALASRRSADLPIDLDGRHLACHVLAIDQADELRPTSSAALEQRWVIASVAASTAAANHALCWMVMKSGADLILLASTQSDVALSRQDYDIARQDLESVIGTLGSRYPQSKFFGGVGMHAAGIDGLVSSVSDARSGAQFASRHGLSGQIASLEASVLDRMLLEILSSPISRQSTSEILRGLDEVDERARAIAVETIALYLDHQCSNVKAGAALNLHPNTVRYRIRKIIDKTSLNLDDPDMRLAVHIACRVELVAKGVKSQAGLGS